MIKHADICTTVQRSSEGVMLRTSLRIFRAHDLSPEYAVSSRGLDMIEAEKVAEQRLRGGIVDALYGDAEGAMHRALAALNGYSAILGEWPPPQEAVGLGDILDKIAALRRVGE